MVGLIKATIVMLALIATTTSFADSAAIDSDEMATLFTTNARYDKTLSTWIVPVHGWIYELEEDSLWRKATVEGLLGLLELDRSALDSELFRSRARMFLVDNQGWQKVRVRIGPVIAEAQRSSTDGHFKLIATLTDEQMQHARRGRWLATAAVNSAVDSRQFTGQVQAIAERGVSIVSDIDDTIKVSQVTDRRALLANTFVKPYEAVPGMAVAYQRWLAAGAVFHYVSASPWQLYPSLQQFMHDAGFPAGSVQLRKFRWKDKSFVRFFRSSRDYKTAAIASLLEAYPGRRFVLLGDSSEHDPEIYGEIARRFPGRVKQIFIRETPAHPSESADGQRFAAAFKSLPSNSWTLIDDGTSLPDYPWPR